MKHKHYRRMLSDTIAELKSLDKTKQIKMPKKKFIAEHKKLLDVLRHPTKEKLRGEAKEQASELEEMKKAPIAYHGSPYPFEEHQRPKKNVKSNLNYGPGIYYATDPEEASSYAEPQVARVARQAQALEDIQKTPGYKAYRDSVAAKLGLASSVDTRHKNWKKFSDHMWEHDKQKVAEKLGLAPNVRRSDVQVNTPFDPYSKEHALKVYQALGQVPNTFRLENEHGVGANLYHHIANEPVFEGMRWGERTWHLNRAIKAAGFDGIHDKKLGHIIAFSPKQIKPAYGAEQKPKKLAASELEKASRPRAVFYKFLAAASPNKKLIKVDFEVGEEPLKASAKDEDTVRLYHITDNANFKLNPNYAPQDNAVAIQDRSGRKGIYTAPSPEEWVNGHGYARPFVAELHVPKSLLADKSVSGRWGREKFIPAEHFDKVKVHRVIPIDAHARETYGSHGWFEGESREEFDTGKPITTKEAYPFRGYRYSGKDAREMSSDEIKQIKQRFKRGYKARFGKSELAKALSPKEVHSQGYSFKILKPTKGGRGFAVRAYHNKKPVGHAVFESRSDSEGYHSVYNSDLEEAHRGKGLYQHMLRIGAEHVKSLGGKGLKSEGFQRSPDATRAWDKIATHAVDRPDVSRGDPQRRADYYLAASELDKAVRSPRKGHTIGQLQNLKDMGWHNPDTGTEISEEEGEAHLMRLRQRKADKQLKEMIKPKPTKPSSDKPEDWLGSSEKMKKGVQGDWKKEGYKLKYRAPLGSGSLHAVTAHDASGKKVGYLTAEDLGDGTFQAHVVAVHPAHQRKGIASAMYVGMQRKTGLKAVPDLEAQSKEGRALWAQSGRKFGKKESDLKLSLTASEKLAKAPLEFEEAEAKHIAKAPIGRPMKRHFGHISSKQVGENLWHHAYGARNDMSVTHQITGSPDPWDDLAPRYAEVEGELNPKDGSLDVAISQVDPEHKGKGFGRLAYEAALGHHGKIRSDELVSPNASKVYEHLQSKGATVKFGKPDTRERHMAITPRKLAASETMKKMSRPRIQFPGLGVPTRLDQDVRLLTTNRQKDIYARAAAGAAIRDQKKVPYTEQTWDPKTASFSQQTSLKDYSAQPARDLAAKRIAGRFSRNALGLSSPVEKDPSGKTFDAALAGKLRTKFEPEALAAKAGAKEKRAEAWGQMVGDYNSKIKDWRAQGEKLISSGATTDELQAHREKRPLLPKRSALPRAPKTQPKDAKDLNPKQVADRGRAIDSTVEHEAFHGLMNRVEAKHGKPFAHRVGKHLLQSFDEPTRDALYDFVASRGYKANTKDPSGFFEEMITHARDILVNPQKRDHFKRIFGDKSEEHIKNIKKGWQKLVNRAKKITPNFEG